MIDSSRCFDGALVRSSDSSFRSFSQHSNMTFLGTRFEKNEARFGAAIETFQSKFEVRSLFAVCAGVSMQSGTN
jgi:hypothetical protein